MKDVWIKKLGEHRGATRLFLDAAQAVRAGFAPGERFEVTVDGQRVVITKQPDGTRTVSSRTRGLGDDMKTVPVIDINSKELFAAFDGMNSVRVVVTENCVYLLPLASEIKKRERFDRLAKKVANGEPLSIGSLAHGGGVLTHAIHQGLADAGIDGRLEFVNELRDDLIDQAIRMNEAWVDAEAGGARGFRDRTGAIAVPMQEVVQDDWLLANLPLLEVLEMGLPCSGASKAGKSKRGLDKMEDHPEVGHLVYAALVILSKTQPAIVLLENVPTYAETASAQILRQQLRDMGYLTHEAILEGKDFGCLENRVRWCLVAATRGVEFDFDQLAPTVRVVRRLADVLDPDIGPDDSRWSAFEYLKVKQVRDAAKGDNFKMQTVDADATSVPTLRKGYHKGGSTDPLLRHPENPELLRKFTPAEHSRIKGVPAHLVDGLSETIAHQLLGQGIVYEPFRAVGERIGRRISRAVEAARERGAAIYGDVEMDTRRDRMTG